MIQYACIVQHRQIFRTDVQRIYAHLQNEKTVLTKRKRYAKINKLSQRAVTKKNRADRRKKERA